MSNAQSSTAENSQIATKGGGQALQSSSISRGAIWRKWDLHLHTPGTAKEDLYKCSLEDFITELEKLSDVAVLGITDYWSIDNWQRLREEQINNHRLAGKLLIPNVELRIIPVTNQNVPINLHVLFDPTMSYGDIQRQFFQQLQFESCGCKFSAIKSDLIALGRHLSGNDHLEETAAWKRGIEQFQVSYTDVKDIVEKPYWQGKCLVGVANGSRDGASGIPESAMRESRCEIYRMADIIFSGNGRDRDYFLGNDCDPAEEVIRQYGSLKPCVMGSDAHTLERLRTWHKGKVTWIKADPTFDGLKQILFEPEERVRIQEEQPEGKSAYQIIESITLSEPGFWDQTIQINPNLVTIIGGRSSGKTTLLNCLAEQIGYFQQYKEKEFSYEEREFVDKHKNSLTVKWADNSIPQDRHVDFFRQNFMINFQDKRDEITKLINRILKDTDKAPLLEQREQFIQSTRNSIMNACDALFIQRNQFEALDAKIKEMGGVEGHAKVVEGLLNQLAEQKKERSGLTDEEQNQFEKLKQEIEGCEARLDSLKRDKEALDVLVLNAKALQEVPIDVSSFSSELGALLLGKHTAIWNNAKAEWIGALQATADEINEKINQLNNRLIQLKQPEIYQKGMVDLEANSALKDLEEKIKLEKAKYADVEALAKKRKRLQEDNQRLIAEIADRHTQYQIEAQTHAANIARTIENLTIKGVVSVKTELLQNKLEGQLTRKSKAQQEFVESIIQHDAFGKKQTVQFLRKVMNREIACNQDVNEEYLVSELLSTNWFDVNYDIIYQGDTFAEMSPGKRAFVILRLLLEFSKNECPILIDQPEDSLDNRAIFNELVQYLRVKKKHRQIILVTHNPNVVVGADAEQVIVANQHGSKNENASSLRFAYVSGALENSRPRNPACHAILEAQGIREHVCEILEGGKEAFKKRENKYGFSS